MINCLLKLVIAVIVVVAVVIIALVAFSLIGPPVLLVFSVVLIAKMVLPI